jgi:glucosamine--fructose-6-phosphate aminotransferase (isomerizing)
MTKGGVRVTDFNGNPLMPQRQRITWDPIQAEKGGFKHFMLKEIYEQPRAVRETVEGRISLDTGRVFLDDMKNLTENDFRRYTSIKIAACGTSWHAGIAGKYMIEQLARVPVEVDYGSEYRYRSPIVPNNTLAVVITQSGETADTLAALREAKQEGACSLSICNVVGSMATRETEGTIYTHAGPEIGVASTKAFTSQLVALYLLGLRLGQARGVLSPDASKPHIDALLQLPQLLEQALKLAPEVEEVAGRFYNRTDFLYLGRGINYPIALEGALKLKEISYIHAEGYPAGEMKHGPIALIDERMPVVTIAPQDAVFEKMIGNMQEVKARGGSVIALTTRGELKLHAILDANKDIVLELPKAPQLLTPIVMTIPLQLLAYDIAVRRGCDVDQPRNLAKSVTVE